jgi:hypothetical protein
VRPPDPADIRRARYFGRRANDAASATDYTKRAPLEVAAVVAPAVMLESTETSSEADGAHARRLPPSAAPRCRAANDHAGSHASRPFGRSLRFA